MTEDFEEVDVEDIPEHWGSGTYDPMVAAILKLPLNKAIKKKYPTHRMAKKKMRSLLSNFHFHIGVRIHTRVIREGDDFYLYVCRHVERE